VILGSGVAPLTLGSRLVGLGLTLLTLLIAAGCASVTQPDLVGHWTLTDQSRQYLPGELRAVAARLDLDADGTFTAVDLPDRHIGTTVVVIVRNGHGTWKLLRFDGKDSVELSFADGSGRQFAISTTFLASSPKLYYFLSDPDSGQRLELVRGQ
jgi:hypothetical protein